MRKPRMTSRELASAMSDVAAGEFSVHPYNIYKPDDPSNVWWLVPKSDPTGPWFKYGKLFFTTDPKVIPFPDSLYSGFYVEKGLSPKLASHFSSYPEWIMGSDWLWGSFITALPTLRLGEGEIILVSAGLRVTDTRHMWDPSRLWFRGSANGSLKLIGSHPSKTQPDIAAFLRDCIAPATEVSELCSVLGKLPEDFDWAWIDLCIGPASPSNKIPAPATLWNDNLKRWSSWVR
jgi:hypothetical protein